MHCWMLDRERYARSGDALCCAPTRTCMYVPYCGVRQWRETCQRSAADTFFRELSGRQSITLFRCDRRLMKHPYRRATSPVLLICGMCISCLKCNSGKSVPGWVGPCGNVIVMWLFKFLQRNPTSTNHQIAYPGLS